MFMEVRERYVRWLRSSKYFGESEENRLQDWGEKALHRQYMSQ